MFMYYDFSCGVRCHAYKSSKVIFIWLSVVDNVKSSIYKAWVRAQLELEPVILLSKKKFEVDSKNIAEKLELGTSKLELKIELESPIF